MEPTVINRVEDDARTTTCDGGEGALGHPVVYLTFADQHDFADCYYCSRRFAKSAYFRHEAGAAT